MPGVYFRQQNSDAGEMLLAGFGAAVEYALTMSDWDYWQMALAATGAQFPFSVWRENLQECYRVALSNFDPAARESTNGPATLDGSNPEVTAPDARARRGWRLVQKAGAPGKKVARHLERMNVAAATEFLVQPVSEERVKEIMRGWMMDERGKDTDAETLQSYISLEDQKMSERNYVTRWLMRPCSCCSCFLGGNCLGIHVVIALGYIVSPFFDGRVLLIRHHAADITANFNASLLLDGLDWLGGAVGALFWWYLSRNIPANLLMASSLLLILMFYFGSTSSEHINPYNWDKQRLGGLIFAAGVLASARLLFLIWNFNEDFHGGFQVGARRVAIVESLRTAVAHGLTAFRFWVQAGSTTTQVRQNWTFVYGSLVLTILVMLAPSCYSSFVLPATNFFAQVSNHKVWVLLMLSLCVNQLASFAGENTQLWMKLNGWDLMEIGYLNLAAALSIVVFLMVAFILLHRMSIWGPWPMRDFVCLLPPGCLLRALAFWDLGHLHYRSWTFLTVIVFSMVLDVARQAAIWTAILTTLANKWYALTGGFMTLFFMYLCTGVSPWICDLVGRLFSSYSPTYAELDFHNPQVNLAQLQKATMAAVWPLALCAWLLQMYARRFFLNEVLTYKGHGNVMPDGTKPWPESKTVFVSSREGRFKKKSSARMEEEDTDGSCSESTTLSEEV